MGTERDRAPGRSGSAGGFTLVELLVVIAIISILAGMLMPAISSALRRAHEASTMSLIHQVQLGCTSYFNDHGDYPPSEWNELDEAMRFDLNGDGVYNRADDEIWLADGSLTVAGAADGSFGAVPPPGSPNATNVGIEVLVACLASRAGGGPYMDLGGKMLGNTNNNTDTVGIGIVTNTSLNSTNLFELVDWWGNPMVYFHNKHYAYSVSASTGLPMGHDGVADHTAAVPNYEDPANPFDPTAVAYVTYIGADGNPYPCYARSNYHTVTGNFPSLDSYQLYSWGSDLYPGRGVSTAPGILIYPGWTAGKGTPTGDQLNGAVVQWLPSDGNLCSWEE